MITLIKRFAASPFSGYLLIALLVAGGGACYWFWTELKTFGGLEERAIAQEETIAIQAAKLDQLVALNDKRQAALTEHSKRSNQLEQQARLYRLEIQEARRNADKATKDCMSMHLADGLQFGPSRQDGDGSDQARSGVDG